LCCISALWLLEERSDQIRQFLNPPQSAEHELLHIAAVLYELPADLAFDVRSRVLIGIELRRIRR
jgi:hypothetical protein